MTIVFDSNNFNTIIYTCLHLGIYVDSMTSIHTGHAFFPFFLYLDKLPYAGKSLTMYKSIARKVNSSLACASNTETPISHIFLKSSTRGARYTSMLLPSYLGPEIRSKILMYLCFIHNQGGKL